MTKTSTLKRCCQSFDLFNSAYTRNTWKHLRFSYTVEICFTTVCYRALLRKVSRLILHNSYTNWDDATILFALGEGAPAYNSGDMTQYIDTWIFIDGKYVFRSLYHRTHVLPMCAQYVNVDSSVLRFISHVMFLLRYSFKRNNMSKQNLRLYSRELKKFSLYFGNEKGFWNHLFSLLIIFMSDCISLGNITFMFDCFFLWEHDFKFRCTLCSSLASLYCQHLILYKIFSFAHNFLWI